MQTLLSGETLEDVSIQRIIDNEPEEGYYLAFSGGKDSQVIYDLCIRASVKFDAHFHMTTVDPPELLQFIKNNYPNVEWDRPKISMFQLIVQEGIPPLRQMRYCCHHLKEMGGRGRIVLTGIRWSESVARSKREMWEISYKDKQKTFFHPIIEWKNIDVWEYIKNHDLEYCSLYNEGFERIGCILCPMAASEQRSLEAKRWPRYYNAYLLAFKRLIEKKSENNREWRLDLSTPEKMMYWWLYGKENDFKTTQTVVSVYD